MIVLDEKKYIEDMIKKGEISSKPSETINMMSKYYIEEGLNKKGTYEKIHEYFFKYYDFYNKVKWESTINKYIETNIKKGYKLVNIEFIPITENEMNKIKKLESIRLQRLAFTMLVIAKMNNMINDKNNGWVNLKDKEIFKYANMKESIKTQCLLLNDLSNKEYEKDKKYISFSKKVDNTNNQVLFIDNEDESNIVIKIDYNTSNIGYIYDDFIGNGKFKKCEVCDEIFKQTNNRGKFCNPCSIKENIRKTSENKKV